MATPTPLTLADSAADPTGTGGIRRAWRAAARLRVRLARAAIRLAVMEHDVLGVTAASQMAVHGADVRMGAYRHLLQNALYRQLQGDWAQAYVRRAWAKGETDARGPSGTTSSAGIESLLNHELEGVVAAITATLARAGFRHYPSKAKAWQGIAAAYDREAAKRVPALIDSLTVRAYNRAKVETYRRRGLTRVGIIPERVPRSHVNDAWQQTEEGDWVFVRSRRAGGRLRAEFEGELVASQTAGDDRVCDDCDAIAADSPYDLDEAMDLLPAHIGCRCAIVEWTGEEAQQDAVRFYVLPVQYVFDFDPDQERDEHGRWSRGSGGLGLPPKTETGDPKQQWAQNIRHTLHRQIELALTVGGGALGASLGGIIGGMLGSAVGAITATQVNKLLTILERRDFTHQQAIHAVAKELGIKLADHLTDAEVEDRYTATRQVLRDALAVLDANALAQLDAFNPEQPRDPDGRWSGGEEQPAYHGTTREIGKFSTLGEPDEPYQPDRMLGYHFAKDPLISNAFVMERINQEERGAKEGGRIIPVTIPSDQHLLEVPQPQYEWAAKEGQPRTNRNIETDEVAIAKMIAREAYPSHPDILATFLEKSRAMHPDEAKAAAAIIASGGTAQLPIDGPHDLGRLVNNFTGAFPHDTALKRALVRTAREHWEARGYKGLKYVNTSPMETMKVGGKEPDPTSYIVFNPQHVKGRYSRDQAPPGLRFWFTSDAEGIPPNAMASV